MTVYCLEDFKVQFDKLKRKNSYKSLEKDILNYFFANGKEITAFLEGTRLNGSSEIPYIKKRLRGSGGWRFYYLIVIKNESLYLMFFHPKTGSDGAENIADDFKASIYKKVLNCIKSNNLYEVKKDQEKLIFIPLFKSSTPNNIIEFKSVNKKL